MSRKFAVPLAVATASLLFADISSADTYTETGDAGDTLATAQVVSSTIPSTSLSSITGTTTLTNAISDSDMFEIYISNPAAFSASTTAFAVGANNFDTQLMLFDASGNGVEANDDSPNGGSQSSLPSGSGLLSPTAIGNYYLLISGSGRYAVDSTGQLIFPNYTDGMTDQTGVYGPNATAGALAGYTGNSNEAGKYVITLTGAQFVLVVVPEPGTYACIFTGLAGLTVVTKLRRNGTK